MNWIWGVIGFLAFGLSIMMAVKLYKIRRNKKNS